MDLYPHQAELLELNPDRYLLAHGTGTGKSLMAIELAKRRKCSILVICPKILKPKWLRDMKDFDPLRVMIVTKEEFKKMVSSPYGISGYLCVIVDEAHTFFGPTSALHKSLVKYFKQNHTPYRYFLTATPYLSTPWNIYAAGVLMGLPLNYIKFRQTFFAEIRMGHRYVWKAREDSESKAKLRALVARMGTSVQLEDVFEVPEQSEEVIMLPMSPEQEKAVEENYDPVPIVRWTKQHLIENGLLGDDPKEEWILEFAKTHGKFVIFARYLHQITRLRQLFSFYKLPVLEIHGSIVNRDAVIQQANKAARVVLLIQASCSEGYELPTFDTVVYASLSFSYKDLVQSKGRVLRANALHTNQYYYLLIENGVDADVWKALQSKQDFSFELLDR